MGTYFNWQLTLKNKPQTPFSPLVLATKMGPKKGKQNSCKKEVPGPRTWPDLPQKLVNLIARHSSLMQNISFGGLTKTWRASTRKCNANAKSSWIQLSDNSDDESRSQTYISHVFKISFYKGRYWWYGRSSPWHQDRWTCFAGYSHGLLMARASEPSDWELWDPLGGCCWYMPPWDPNIPFKFAAISSSAERPNGRFNPLFLLVLTGISFPAFVFYKIGEGTHSWIKQDSNLIDPYSSDKKLMQFSNCVEFKGKFYAVSLQGTLAVIEDIDSQLRITALGSSRAVPSVTSRHFKEYLAESDGEILLVFLISKKFIDIVDEIEVFRLEFPRLSWVKVESLRDQTLFVGSNCCMFVTASKVGCRSNCIYFTQHDAVDWWLYDMKSNTMITVWNEADSAYKIPSLGEETLAT